MSVFKHPLPLALVAGTALLGVATPQAHAIDAIVTPVLTRPLPEFPGKEVLIITVEYPPGAADPIHRHDAHGFIYVLEGTIVMQVKGGKETTLTAGQTFYEAPDDLHVVGRNASDTEPARFLVMLVKNSGAPVLTVEQESRP